MKGDFTRFTFRRNKGYSGVRLQQGRVLLDADWNEQVDIGNHQVRTLAKDLIGAGVLGTFIPAPAAPEGDPTDFKIQNGARIYVEGVLVENETETIDASGTQGGTGSNETILTVTSLLLDGFPLLQGAHVAVKVVVTLSGQSSCSWMETTVKSIVPSSGSGYKIHCDQISLPTTASIQGLRRLYTFKQQPFFVPKQPYSTGTVYLDVWEAEVTSVDDNAINEPALGGPDTALRSQTRWKIQLFPPPDPTQPGPKSGIRTNGRLSVQCGGQGADNRLYRVEVHQSGDIDASGAGPVVFKWSSDNGAVVAGWTPAQNGQVAVTPGTYTAQDFAIQANQLVELSDEREFEDGSGRVLANASLTGVNLTIAPADGQSGIPASITQNPRIRRWGGRILPSDITTSFTHGAWVPLENGLQVKFEPGHYEAGDYWLIPVRQGAVLFPSGLQAPDGIEHHCCLLGWLDTSQSTWLFASTQPVVSSLTGISQALWIDPQHHVISTNPQYNVGIGTRNPQVRLEVAGNLQVDNGINSLGPIALNDNVLALRKPNDPWHGIGHRNTFGGAGIDGPAMFGWSGGVLGSTSSTTSTPVEKAILQWDVNNGVHVFGDLNLAGGNWDVSNANGDLKIGDDKYHLKMGVALGGGGAGDVRLRAHGGTNRMMLGGGQNDVVTITDTKMGIGTIGPQATLHVAGNLQVDSGALVKGNVTAGAVSIEAPGVAGWSFMIDLNRGNLGLILDGPSNLFNFDKDGTFEAKNISAVGYVQVMGRVGIGTTDPKAALHVAGDLQVDGPLRAPSGINASGVAAGGVILGGQPAPWHFEQQNGICRLYRDNGGFPFQFTADGAFVKKTNQFVISHPLDPQNKELVHACIEGPEAAVYYRGEGQFQDGIATIELPAYFEALTRKEDRTVQLTPLWDDGDTACSSLAASRIKEGRFTVRAIDRNNHAQRFYWEVKAVRADVPPLVIERLKQQK